MCVILIIEHPGNYCQASACQDENITVLCLWVLILFVTTASKKWVNSSLYFTARVFEPSMSSNKVRTVHRIPNSHIVIDYWNPDPDPNKVSSSSTRYKVTYSLNFATILKEAGSKRFQFFRTNSSDSWHIWEWALVIWNKFDNVVIHSTRLNSINGSW